MLPVVYVVYVKIKFKYPTVKLNRNVLDVQWVEKQLQTDGRYT